MIATCFIDVTVSAESVLDDLEFAICCQLEAGTTDCTLVWELNAIPVRLALEDQAAMAVRAKTHVRIAQPFTFFNRGLDCFYNVFTQFVHALNVFRMCDNVARLSNSGDHVLVDDVNRCGEHGCAEDFQGKTLPVMAGTADCDQSGDHMRIDFDSTDL